MLSHLCGGSEPTCSEVVGIPHSRYRGYLLWGSEGTSTRGAGRLLHRVALGLAAGAGDEVGDHVLRDAVTSLVIQPLDTELPCLDD